MLNINIETKNEIIETENNGIITRSFSVQRKNKDGEIVTKTIFTPALVDSYERMTYLKSLKEVSEKGLCIEISDLNDEMLKKEGFKGGVTEYIKEVFGTSLASNTALKYRKVGLIFGEKVTDENGKITYRWKSPIDSDVSVTNLSQILGLLGLPRDFAKLSDKEIEKIFNEFIQAYIISGKLHLSATNAILREEIADLQTTIIKANATEITENTDTENTDTDTENTDTDTENSEETAKQNAISAVDALKIYFKGNKEATKALAVLAKLLG